MTVLLYQPATYSNLMRGIRWESVGFVIHEPARHDNLLPSGMVQGESLLGGQRDQVAVGDRQVEPHSTSALGSPLTQMAYTQ